MNDDFKKLLKAASFGLKAFSFGLHQVAKNIDDLAASQTTSQPEEETPPRPSPETEPEEHPPKDPEPTPQKTASAGPKKKKLTDTDIILSLIVNAKEGIDINAISRETGFPNRKISDTVHRLKRQGKIRNPKPGFYVKA